ncbi:MAG: hypothetical protein LBE76_01770 [Nitrososphaerota archaeon]|jgi:hypothetical protein|nr:hypothetical protein [Nitrososphaerota archaeon]
MLATYKGQVRDGKPMLTEDVILPENASLIITVLNEKYSENTKTKAQQQNEALKRLSKGLKAINDEPFDAKFDAIINRRFNITRELNI